MRAEIQGYESKISELKESHSLEISTWETPPYKRAKILQSHGPQAFTQVEEEPSQWQYDDQCAPMTYVEHTLTRTVQYESITIGSSEYTKSKEVPWYRKNRVATGPLTRESFRTGLELLTESQRKDANT